MLDPTVLAGQQAELSRLLAEPRVLKVPGFADVSVQPFRFTHLASVAKLAGPIVETLVINPAMKSAHDGITDALGNVDMEMLFLQILESHPAELNGLLALATGLTEEQIAQLGAMAGVDLCALMFEVNADFFARALPMISRIRMRQILGQFASTVQSQRPETGAPEPTASPVLGPEQPAASSEPVIDGPTS